MGLMNFSHFSHPCNLLLSPLSHMLSSVVKTAYNGPANNALFVLDMARKKPDAEGQKAEETLLLHAYICFFSFYYTSGLCWKYLS